MNRIYMALYSVSSWLMQKMEPSLEIEYSIQGTRYVHYHFEWRIEDRKLVAVLVAKKGYE